MSVSAVLYNQKDYFNDIAQKAGINKDIMKIFWFLFVTLLLTNYFIMAKAQENNTVDTEAIPDGNGPDKPVSRLRSAVSVATVSDVKNNTNTDNKL